jgi:hypothetical protein
MPEGHTTEPPRPGYLITAEDGTRVAVYCSGCTSFFVKGFSGEVELQAFKDGRPFRRVSNCPYSRDCPSYCWGHEVTYVGDAPAQMVEWLESSRSDWPKASEDFVEGGDA